MRLWHKDLIPVLPRQQLLSQWRECCCIARNIAVNGTPNHILVNPIMNYPIEHFIVYSRCVMQTMSLRGYKVNCSNFDKYGLKPSLKSDGLTYEELFKDWHNDRYLRQCYYNLQEKYDRGGIPEDEWLKIQSYLIDKKEDIKWLLHLRHEDEKKGEWLRMSDLPEKDDDRYKCSRCGNVVHYKNKMDLYTFNSWCGRCGSNNER